MTVEASPADQLASLAEADDVPLQEALAFFDALPAVETDAMLGDWEGGVVRTGHPGEGMLGKLRWAGKAFHGADEVDPMVCLNEAGEREPSDVLGAATLRRVEYRGVVTATMVYDKQPVFDHFRAVDADTVLGVMDRKGEDHPLVFFLRRRAPA